MSTRNARCRQSLHCILPPHILKNVAQNGSPQQRSRVLRSLSTDQTLRTMRAAALASKGTIGRAPRPVAQATGQKQISVFDAKGTQTLPGDGVLVNGNTDIAVVEAVAGLAKTFDFYWDVFDRNSIDDEGLPLNATVHFGQDYDNAFWDGERMVFGDGDGELFNRFTISLDVIGHELTHGVTEDEARLMYQFQPGALNESMSDVFGTLVKQKANNQTAEKADWLIGAELLTKNVKGVALRSMKAPGTAFEDPVLGKDPQPSHWENFVHTFEDNGGVHINSGIPNHAFFLLATSLGGYAWEKPGRIWYETLRDGHLRPNSGFKSFARLTYRTAQRLYQATSTEAKAVLDAWARVGIKIQ